MGKRVLVVDDDREFVDMLAEIMGAQGYTVTPCFSPQCAVAQARLMRPDVVIVDLVMPGCTGWQVIKELRADPATAKTDVIVCTASQQALARKRELDAAGCDLLVKPFELDELFALLSKGPSDNRRAS